MSSSINGATHKLIKASLGTDNNLDKLFALSRTLLSLSFALVQTKSHKILIRFFVAVYSPSTSTSESETFRRSRLGASWVHRGRRECWDLCWSAWRRQIARTPANAECSRTPETHKTGNCSSFLSDFFTKVWFWLLRLFNFL